MIEFTRIGRIVPPLVTPFEVDCHIVGETGVHQLIERLIAQGCAVYSQVAPAAKFGR